MEWVNTTAKTLPEAIDLALDNLGVDEAEAEIEVLEEPKQGLFGRMRGNARVRARVKPKATRPKVERGRNRKRRNEGGRDRSGGAKKDRNRKKSASADGGKRNDSSDRKSGQSGRSGDDDQAAAASGTATSKSGGQGGQGRTDSRGRRGGRGRNDRGSQNRGSSDPVEEASMDEVSETLDTFLTGLTEAFGFEGAVSVDEDDGGLLASVEGRHGLMVGPKGRTLDAIQELARVTAQRSTPSNIRIKVDVGGYRALRREALVTFALDAAEEARADGKERSLEPMNSADRKVVHDALSEVADVETRSAGTDPRRRVVIVPVGVADDDADDVADDEATEPSASDSSASDADAADDAASDGVDNDDDGVDAESDSVEAANGGDDPDDPSSVDESESVGSQ